MTTNRTRHVTPEEFYALLPDGVPVVAHETHMEFSAQGWRYIAPLSVVGGAA